MMELFNVVSAWTIPVFVTAVVVYASWKKVPVFETFVQGGKEGLHIAVGLIPYLVGMLVALGIFRSPAPSTSFVELLNPLTSLLGIPAEVLPGHNALISGTGPWP